MTPEQRQVKAFHEQFGCTVGADPALRDADLSAVLIMEEAVETVAAMGFEVTAVITGALDRANEAATSRTIGGHWTFWKKYDKPDMIEVIDGLCDLLYVTYGAAVRSGIDLEPFFAEVHRSNMEKTGGDTRADGKILKPEGWVPPKIAELLEEQVFNRRKFHGFTEETERWWASRPQEDL